MKRTILATCTALALSGWVGIGSAGAADPTCLYPDLPNCGEANGAGEWEPEPTYPAGDPGEWDGTIPEPEVPLDGGPAPEPYTEGDHPIHEDEPGWDCTTMGNKVCGVPDEPVEVEVFVHPISDPYVNPPVGEMG